MNIFVLDSCPIRAAQFHVDKHVVKMVIEIAQLLSTTHHMLESGTKDMYRPTHHNHPCAVWLRKSSLNYRWAHTHLLGLLDEYTLRYGKVHKTAALAIPLEVAPPRLVLYQCEHMTPYALAMPDEYKISKSAITCYREYYKHGKKDLHKWTRRPKPDWI